MLLKKAWPNSYNYYLHARNVWDSLQRHTLTSQTRTADTINMHNQDCAVEQHLLPHTLTETYQSWEILLTLRNIAANFGW